MELDLKVWKEIAVEKQMLMRTVTDSLGLEQDASEIELKDRILAGVNQIAEAETAIAKLKGEHMAAISGLQQRLEDTQKLLAAAEESIATLNAEKATLENTLKSVSETSRTEALNLKTQVDQKVREIKNIKTMLGDAPEKIVAKMKALNKKKFDATESHQRAERDLKIVKKEKRELQQTLDLEKAKTETLEKELEELRAKKKPADDSGDEASADVNAAEEEIKT